MQRRVKKGSKMRACVARSMPVPVSLTANVTCGPAFMPTCSFAWLSVRRTSSVSMVSLPPRGMASRAFTARFMMTCSICPGSTLIDASPAAATAMSSTSSPIRIRSIFSIPPQMSLRSTILGASTCCRLNASRCRVKLAARFPARATRARQVDRLEGACGCRRGWLGWVSRETRAPVAPTWCDRSQGTT